tara:strand:+ start:2312 stop:3514 length:1203 start_codon:yes stop_codon:yes gene_type:complete
MAVESGPLFGTAAELTQFAQIFFGSLIVALLYFVIRHFKGGIALPGSLRYDWTVLGLALWCFAGLSIDAWGHKHGAVDESFFTPWHAIWYSGFTAYASYIVWALWRLHDGPIPKSLTSLKQFFGNMPKGYNVGVIGMLLFMVSGFGDMLWHAFLGLEGGLDILLSPTHLGLAAGLVLSLMVPVMTAWHSPGSGKTLAGQMPVLFGLGATWGVFILFTSYTHHQVMPFGDLCANLNSCDKGNFGLENGVTAILLQSVILNALIFFFIKRWKPVMGTFTILLTVNSISIAANAPGELSKAWQHLLAPILAGILIDIAYFGYGNRTRLFAFCVPAIHCIVWMLVLVVRGGFQVANVNGDLVMSPLGWSVHATIGAIFLAGSAGLLTSFLTHPPNIPGSAFDDD